MGFLKSKSGAVVLAALVVVGSTLLNTRVKLGAAVDEVEDLFFTDRDGEKCI